MGELPSNTSNELILVAQPWKEPSAAIDRLTKKFPGVEIVYRQTSFMKGSDRDHLPDDVYRDATILFTLRDFPSAPSASPNLQLVQLSSAGADLATRTSLFKDTDIPFANASGVHGPQITEWFILTLLAANHSYNALYEAQKERTWQPNKGNRVSDLVGQRLGILGYGSIGRQAANAAKAFGMDVIAYTASPRDTPEKRRDDGYIVPGTGDKDGSIPSQWFHGTEKKDLHHFLSQDIDVLLVGVPLTPATHHMLSTEEFSILSKKKAFVSNIARGPIIDPQALKQALVDGKLRGAALDVTEPEPLPEGDDFWAIPNLTITPHISGNTDRYLERAFGILELQLERKAQGLPFINVVDRERGY